MKHTALILMVLLGAVTGGCGPETEKNSSQPEAVKAPGRRPSVLFYVIDTCRADRMSLYGHNRKTTPFLDYLAKKSVVFENCFSQASWTKPSVGSILTSRYPSETGCFALFQRMSSSFRTFPEVLMENGYFTKGVSANPIMGMFSNFSQGFTEFTESARINHADPIRFASGSAKLLNDIVFPWLNETDHWPMLLYMFSVDPHEEYEPEPLFMNRFANPDRMEQYRKEWQSLLKTRPDIPGNRVIEQNFIDAGVETSPFIKHGLDLYDADICANDYQLMMLWSRIEDDEWGDDMIVVITSDHGEEFYEHGGTCHGYSLYNELLHVPLLIYAPKLLPQGIRIKNPVQSIDIYPTLLDLLGVASPAETKGNSLLPLINGHEQWKDRPVFSENNEDPMCRVMGEGAGVAKSMITGQWKFIINFKPPSKMERPKYELYNIKDDPKETNNLAGSHSKLVCQFEKQDMKWSSESLESLETGEQVMKKNLDPAVIEQLEKLGYLR